MLSCRRRIVSQLPSRPLLSAYPWCGTFAERMIRSRNRAGSTAAVLTGSTFGTNGTATATAVSAATTSQRLCLCSATLPTIHERRTIAVKRHDVVWTHDSGGGV